MTLFVMGQLSDTCVTQVYRRGQGDKRGPGSSHELAIVRQIREIDKTSLSGSPLTGFTNQAMVTYLEFAIVNIKIENRVEA